jgi:hypothetical protein
VTSRKLGSVAALAMITLISAGCSNAPATTGTPAGTGTAGTGSNTTGTNNTGTNNAGTSLAQAVKFSQCMRANGVSGFPDPDASGQLTIDGVVNGSSLNPNSPAFQQALTACKDLQPPGFMGNTRTAQQQEAALKFAQCIRDNGVPDFPDPTSDGPLVDTNRIPSAATTGGMSILNAAMHKCGAIYSGQLGLPGR